MDEGLLIMLVGPTGLCPCGSAAAPLPPPFSTQALEEIKDGCGGRHALQVGDEVVPLLAVDIQLEPIVHGSTGATPPHGTPSEGPGDVVDLVDNSSADNPARVEADESTYDRGINPIPLSAINGPGGCS